MNLYGDEKRGLYFRKAEEGKQMLIRPDGTFRISEETSQAFEALGVQANEGWQRSMLLCEELGIWDRTAFGCTMKTILAFSFLQKNMEYALLFISCEQAERKIYQSLPEKVVLQCRKNVDAFYANPELQKRWEGIILHPVCLKYVKGSGEFVPMTFNEIGNEDTVLHTDYFVPVSDISDIEQLEEQLFSRVDRLALQDSVVETLVIERAGYKAFAVPGDQRFIVLKGSTINPEITGVLPAKTLKMREEGLQNGVISDKFELLDDVVFASSSAAAAFVVGHTVSGPKTWKTKS